MAGTGLGCCCMLSETYEKTAIFRSFHRTASSTTGGFLLYIILSTTVSFLDLKDAILFLQCLLFCVYISIFFTSTLCMCVMCLNVI